jgi:hypothetical protein
MTCKFSLITTFYVFFSISQDALILTDGKIKSLNLYVIDWLHPYESQINHFEIQVL